MKTSVMKELGRSAAWLRSPHFFSSAPQMHTDLFLCHRLPVLGMHDSDIYRARAGTVVIDYYKLGLMSVTQ